MSLTTGIEQPQRRSLARPYPRLLPQWALDACRPVVAVFSRACWRIRWRRKEHIPLAGGLIIAGNHQTYIDPFWIACQIKRPVRFLAWDAAFTWPLVGRMLGLFGAWPLNLEGNDPAPIRLSIRWLREGGAVLLFPEGGRGNPDGSMKKFKAGAVRMALEAGVPILPVTVRGGQRVWPNDYRVPRVGPAVEVIYHPIFLVEQRAGEDVRECARRESARLAQIIESVL